MNHKVFKPIAIAVLFFFSWTFAGICNFAYAVDNLKDPSPQSQTSQTPKPEEKIQKTIEDIGAILDDQSIDTGTKKAKAKAKKEEIGSLDVEIKKQFAETEKKLKDANLPDEILQRHYKFTKHYEDNLNELKTNLDAIDKAQTEAEVKAEVEKTKAHLERTKPPKRHIPLDPNKLPNRVQKLPRKDPRLNKEDFNQASVNTASRSQKPEARSQNTEGRSQNAESFTLQSEFPAFAETLRAGRRNPQFNKPILVASNGSLKGLLSPNSELIIPNDEPNIPNSIVAQSSVLIAQTLNPPTPDDLAQTIEVQFTPEIIAKAQELGNNPVKIYEYVKNNFFFEAYYGSLKGAHETLLEQGGNDFDQASLLLALLRISNIPARYVYGTVEIPIERMKKWLGVENENVVGDMLASNGIPVSLVQEGGKISKTRLEHVWVETWISYDNYRGQPNSQNKTWVPLDPSFKQLTYIRGPDLKQIMNFDPNAFMNELMANSTYSTSDYYVSHVSESFIQQKLQEYQNNLQNYVTANIPNATPQDLIGKFDILYEKLGILPATLPYKIIVKGATYSVVPDNLRHKLQINIKGIDYGNLSGSGDINYQTNLTQLAGKKITISYLPATIEDENTLKSYGTLSTTPAYLVNMKPILMIDGVSVAAGGNIGLGLIQQVDITFSSPNVPTDIVTHNLNAGGYHAIGIDLQRIPKILLQKQTARMQAMKTYLESILSGNPSAPPPGDSRDSLLGDMLYGVAINYFYNLNALNDLLSRVTDIVWVRQPSEAMTFVDLKVSTIFGIPLTANPVGMSIDVSRNIISPFSITENKNMENAFKLNSGLNSSVMEHTILERSFNVDAVSTAKVLKTATTFQIPMYAVTRLNIEQVLPNLQISNDVINDIRSAANAGKFVVIPKTEMQINTWSGTGYIVLDQYTFDTVFRISGGISGGYTTPTDEQKQANQWLGLFGVVNRLLVYSSWLLELGGVSDPEIQSIIEGTKNEVYFLIENIDPQLPDPYDANEVLNNFETSIVNYILAMNYYVPLLEFYAHLPLEASAIALIELINGWVASAILIHLGIQASNKYMGYFIIHYLYEYVVLFSVGMVDAFPEGF